MYRRCRVETSQVQNYQKSHSNSFFFVKLTRRFTSTAFGKKRMSSIYNNWFYTMFHKLVNDCYLSHFYERLFKYTPEKVNIGRNCFCFLYRCRYVSISLCLSVHFKLNFSFWYIH